MTGNRTAVAALVGAAFLFGVTFVVVKDAVADFPPMAFIGWRFVVGAGALLLVAPPRGRAVWRDGAFAGAWLFAGFALQTAGIVTTGASSSALITGVYVVLTPLLAAAWHRHRPSRWAIGGSALAFLGLGLLTLRTGFTLGTGDLLTLGCAVAFAGHIVFLSEAARRHPAVPFTAVQLTVTAILGLLASLVVDGPMLPGRDDWAPILLTGLGVSAVAFLLQVWAQSQLGPVRTAVILSGEPVFGVAMAALILGERLAPRAWVGAALVLGAVYVVLLHPADRSTVEAEAVTAGH